MPDDVTTMPLLTTAQFQWNLRKMRRITRQYQLFTFVLLVTLLLFISAYFNFHSSQFPISDVSSSSTSNPDTARRKSSYHPNIFFLKVHKCASSTVQNILMRYGDRHNLNFGLPYTANYLGHPQPFHPDMVIPIVDGQSYNVICHHSRFNETSVQQLLPSDAIYVAIIRDPVHLFESIFAYCDLGNHYGMSIEDFVDMPSWWFNTCPRHLGRFGLNQIAFDLGIDEKDFHDVTKIANYIEEFDRIFDLVLIADYFEESLILLKHLLGLSFEEIAYIVHNERISSEKLNITPALADKVRRVNHVDQQIYEHFLETFHRRVQRFGNDRMKVEVDELRKQNEFWNRFCGFRRVVMTKDEDPMYRQYLSHKVHGIEFDNGEEKTDSVCKYLALPEIQFTVELRMKHIQRHGSFWQKLLFWLGYYKY